MPSKSTSSLSRNVGLLQDLQGKKVTVMGLGLHGGALGTIRWLHEQKAVITVTDLKSAAQLASTLEKLRSYHGINFVLGEHRDEDFTDADLVIRNPAVPRTSRFLQLAESVRVPIEMDSSLFFQYCPTKNIIGITGSKGKSTTTHAIAHLLQIKYPQAVTVGIDGQSPLGALGAIGSNSLVIFELSSWRLEALASKSISPQTAVVTSLYRDHLNTYASYEEYIETKKIIIRYQHTDDRVLLNADDPLLRTWTPEIKGQLYWYSLSNNIPSGSQGIYVDRGMITIALPRGASTLFPLNELPLPAAHERRNMLPAILLGFLGNIPVNSIKLNLRHLKGLAHRLESVRTLNSITFINDSAATMPDATIAALQALKDKHIVHILGGSDKKLNFEDLARAESNAKIRSLVFLPGDATPRMQRQIAGAFGSPPPVHIAGTMPDAVAQAYQIAAPGDVVLLSPGATSFGLFQHEFDRGDQFKKAVQQLG